MQLLLFQKMLKLVVFILLFLLVVSCSTTRFIQAYKFSDSVFNAQSSQDSNHIQKDGAPWWDVDISKIQDATPTLHSGSYKVSPYTVLGKNYFPLKESKNYVQSGIASWYGTKFNGRNTANGEVYDLYGMSAAHKTLPLPSYVRVTNLDNNRSVILRVNDRGPFYSDRIIDLSYAAAKKLGYAEIGTARVKVESINPIQYLAQSNKLVPLIRNEQQTLQLQVTASADKIEQRTPRFVAFSTVVVPHTMRGALKTHSQYLQVGAFANQDAAKLLRFKLSGIVNAPVFIGPIMRNQQILYCVRIGPISSPSEVVSIQNSIRLISLRQPSIVTAK
ncbi:septal ring lytic transglycosylase RlpA family protein [Candidatus Pseudomonas adelgestsugas]|uniref:Endolytic peptidoglycan transglycosylase RlpA n=1 Tax=Candidatus Pseudomonas adelgestsugas TaxID=1302376 RepID=A0ABX5R7Z8_9PSED|nr:septal ring lytic transglycosylase RlpA family protein [Candidatus Pseudomonas adelgestsugas]QAX81683.1 RlpA-like protein precursor [Candidatus Pseudomonas adelgestsugas]